MSGKRNLTLISAWVNPVPFHERLRREAEGECPRSTPFETVVDTDIMNAGALTAAPALRRFLYRFVPTDVAIACEAFLRRNGYRVVIAWTDIGALVYALLLKATRQRSPCVAMMFWISKPGKARLLKLAHTHIDRIILWTSNHRQFALEELDIPPSKIAYIPHFVDQMFFRPPAPGRALDTICSAGREMRDYPTLLQALNGLDIPCHIAAGNFRGTLEPTIRAIYEHGPLPRNVTVGLLSPPALRDLYARSRFVVVPLLPTDSDNGLSVILEAMAMGKAVICSRVQGQRDVVQEGKTGIYVSPLDPVALRTAILSLWENPGKAEEMGREGRHHIERYHTLDSFVAQVRNVVDAVAAEHDPRSALRKDAAHPLPSAVHRRAP